jgi:hypothetical protein
MDRGMLNDRTTSEMECPIRLAPTFKPHSNSSNLHRLAVRRLAGVHPASVYMSENGLHMNDAHIDVYNPMFVAIHEENAR